MPREIATPWAIWTNCAKRLIGWKPTKRSDPTASTGEPSTAHYGRWPKIVRCGDDLQDPSGDPRRRRPRRNPRARLPGADRFEAGDAGPDLGRRQSHPEGLTSNRGRRAGKRAFTFAAALAPIAV